MDRQNAEADRERLTRFKNDTQLARAKKQHLLVRLPSNRHLSVDGRLQKKFRYCYCRPWVRIFLLQTADDLYAWFSHGTLQVNSAVRTVAYQQALRRRNPNGSARSVHTTGAAVDIAKLNLLPEQVQWMRQYLLKLEAAGVIEVTEEHNQECFHVMVFETYPTYHPR